MRFLLAISTFRIAAALESGKWCFAGCELALGYVDFNDTGAGAKKITSCRSRLRATSTYLCIDEYCSKDGRENWLHSANETCQHNSNVFLPPFEIIADYTPEDRARIERLTADDAFGYPTLEGVVIPEKSFFERAFKTLVGAQSIPTASAGSLSLGRRLFRSRCPSCLCVSTHPAKLACIRD